MRVEQKCRWMLTFFGLTPEFKVELHKSIFQLITFGKGGWNWSDLYKMPVYLRNFYFGEMIKVNRAEQDRYQQQQQTNISVQRKPPKFKRK